MKGRIIEYLMAGFYNRFINLILLSAKVWLGSK